MNLELRNEIEAKIREKTYTSLLVNLLKKMEVAPKLESFTKYYKEIIKYITNDITSNQTRKTMLSGLFVITGIEDYKTSMLEFCRKVAENYKEQKLYDKQKANLVSFAEVKLKLAELLKKLRKEKTPDNYINYLLLAMMSGVYFPPRRNEYCSVKIKNIDVNKDNYLIKNVITFNKFKTVKRYDTQEVILPKELMTILKQWLKINTTDYLFYNPAVMKVLNSDTLGKRLYRIFGGKTVGCDALRSAYLTEMYKDVPALKKMEDTAEAMGHSYATALNSYVKKP